ncbi:MAG: carotenoid biosynthesis protein [Anaerolineales bacterium]|nr:carotenoid biosynthesis protein [Anaerolineales bacterium]
MTSEKRLNRFARWYLPVIFTIVVVISTLTRHLTTALPASQTWANMAALDVLVVVLMTPLLIHCLRKMGTTDGLLFFFTVSIFMGSLEALWVFLGKLGVLGDAYDYTTGLLWFLGIPLTISVGWFIWMYVFYLLTQRIFPGASPLSKALLCGLLGLCTDLWMDPAIVNYHLISTGPNLWNWTPTQGPVILSVPLYNFIGWFLSGATVVYVYQIAWRSRGQPRLRLRTALLRVTVSWIIFVIGTKSIQLILDAALPGLNLFPLMLEAGSELSLLKKIMLGVVPAWMLLCFGLYIWQALRNPAKRPDILLLLGYFASVGFNLNMVYGLQTAFPQTFVVYLVVFPMLLPFGMLTYYLVSPTKTTVSDG